MKIFKNLKFDKVPPSNNIVPPIQTKNNKRTGMFIRESRIAKIKLNYGASTYDKRYF